MKQQYFNEMQEQAILSNIMDAESNTSGEIRVHVERYCKAEPMARAINIFKWLGMTHTEHRNGVLLYLALQDRKFAIIGDAGINKTVPPEFWNTVSEEMTVHFKAGKIAEGICEGIRLTGEKLKIYFPYERGDRNELPDEISTL